MQFGCQELRTHFSLPGTTSRSTSLERQFPLAVILSQSIPPSNAVELAQALPLSWCIV